MTRQEAIEKLCQHFIQNELDNGGTEEGCKHLITEEDILDELNNWYDNDSPSIVGEFIIDVLTKDQETHQCAACSTTHQR